MARPQSVAGGRPHVVTIRLSEAEMRKMNALKGSLKAAEFFRLLLNATQRSD